MLAGLANKRTQRSHRLKIDFKIFKTKMKYFNDLLNYKLKMKLSELWVHSATKNCVPSHK